MRLKIKQEANGVHPNEVVISVQTCDGLERLVVHKRSLESETIEIGYPIGSFEDRYLVELPRETMRGLWRIGVKKALVLESERLRA